MSSDIYSEFPDTRFYNLAEVYSEFIPFTANAVYPVHRWYRFKEGYSRDLVHLLLGSVGRHAKACLDPFGGSGTTALACQEVGLKCHSFEVNPFLHSVAQSKLETSYTVNEFEKAVSQIKVNLDRHGTDEYEIPIMSTITKRPQTDKWLFAPSTLQAILAIRYSISKTPSVYKALLLTILASILPDIGNTIKDGKCVRYKKGWRQGRTTRNSVYRKFFERCQAFREDINYLETRSKFSNRDYCRLGSSLDELSRFPEQAVELVITSPPYLNSFDYTDVYMPELWALGFVSNYEDVRNLRAKTLRSHVQVKWKNDNQSLNGKIKPIVDQIVQGNEQIWNSTIPNMITGYFSDMANVLRELRRIISPGGKLCIIVGTSSYYKVTIPTDLLLAEIAISLGFRFDELRIIRELKRSTKQTTKSGKALPPLRESLLILTAP